jgi:D-alanyl-D-alanine carboxypeptidase
MRPAPVSTCRPHSLRVVSLAAVGIVSLLAVGCTDDTDWAAPSIAPEGTAEVRVGASTMPPATGEELSAALVDTMERYGVPGAAVAITDPELGEWRATAGDADGDADEPMTGDLVWPIRSITKSFTVTALLQLADDGELDLDDTIDEWVDDVPDGDRITLRQLASMTAGVPEYTNDAFVEEFSQDPTAPFSAEQLIGFALEGEPVSEPGEVGIYVNTSTVLLGQVVEEVAGQPLDEVLQERVLDPLGLDSTAYVTSVDGWTGPHPAGYQPDGDELVVPPTNFTVFDAAGAMVATLDDLLAWGPALANGELLEDDTQRDRLQGAPLDEGPEYDVYAVGTGSLDGWWGHTGEGFGYTVLVMHQRETGATVAIGMNLSNVGDHPPTKLFRQIAAILADAA